MEPITATDPSLATFAAYATNGAGMTLLKKAMDASSSTVGQLMESLPQPKSLDPAVGQHLDVRA
ncbi:MAG: YjfB family protein [Acidimicrobiia bacterium]